MYLVPGIIYSHVRVVLYPGYEATINTDYQVLTTSTAAVRLLFGPNGVEFYKL